MVPGACCAHTHQAGSVPFGLRVLHLNPKTLTLQNPRNPQHGRTKTGTITEEGQVACECKACMGAAGAKGGRAPSVSCSEFEEHAGSRERRPGESIYLTRISTSLKARPCLPELAALERDE